MPLAVMSEYGEYAHFFHLDCSSSPVIIHNLPGMLNYVAQIHFSSRPISIVDYNWVINANLNIERVSAIHNILKSTQERELRHGMYEKDSLSRFLIKAAMLDQQSRMFSGELRFLSTPIQPKVIYVFYREE